LSKYFVDAWAWVEYLIGSDLGARVNQILSEEGNDVYTCAITLAEVISKTARERRDTKAAYALLSGNSQVVEADEELSVNAGLVQCEMRKTMKDFGLADAYVLATARKLNAKILTGDPHFKGMKEAILIK
jgi:predicted nucleic acid-binding protein